MLDSAPIAQAVDFIEDHLQAPIGVADMAAAVSYSLYHFCRTFNQATHHTPYDYLMRRRLAEAARALLETEDKIIDVALDYQFNNPETFSRAFKRVLGLQPSQWRKAGHLDPRRLMPRLTRAHIEQIARGAYPRPEVVELDPFQVAGLMTIVREDTAATSRLWDLLAQESAAHADPASTPAYCALSIYPDNWAEAGYLYLAGFEATGWDLEDSALGSSNLSNSGLVRKAIPALTCARASHLGAGQDLRLTLDYVYHAWLPRSGWRRGHPWVIERFSQDPRAADSEQPEREVYIPVRSPQ
jgi:AraC family transcriptional regulator